MMDFILADISFMIERSLEFDSTVLQRWKEPILMIVTRNGQMANGPNVHYLKDCNNAIKK